ncbi:Pisatin demethylase [Paramyrothecium foliicola]|nr:Pisatin demethylase [Paramyrothecium foliicola]
MRAAEGGLESGMTLPQSALLSVSPDLSAFTCEDKTRSIPRLVPELIPPLVQPINSAFDDEELLDRDTPFVYRVIVDQQSALWEQITMLQLLTNSSIWVVAALAMTLALLHRAFGSGLAKARGPFYARFTDLWYVYHIYNGRFEHENISLHKKYGEFPAKDTCDNFADIWIGSIVRYGPNRFSLSSPDAFKKIYSHGSEFPKSTWYDTWSSPHQWNLFGDTNRKRHAINRRQYQSTYSMSSLVNYEAFVDECSDIFLKKLMETTEKEQEPVDMGHWFQCYAFDVIGLITYSKRLGFLNCGQDVAGVMKNLEDHLSYASLVGVYSWLHPLLFKLRNWKAGAKGTGRQYIINFTKERMEEHQRSEKYSKGREDAESEVQEGTIDFLAKFFQKHSQNEEAFSEYHIQAGCVSNMVAGSDTTAISLSAILYYLLRTPPALEKLRNEVNDLCDSENSDHVPFHISQQMPYLQAVIKEALRLHPATGLPLERVVPGGGTTIDGQFFPPGSIVGINTWVAHRDTSVFGPDANEFKPDRWLKTDPETLRNMNQFWMPFGLASRTCIGRHISILEISKLIPRLIRDFDMELISKEPWKTANRWFVKPVNFQVTLRPRKPHKE